MLLCGLMAIGSVDVQMDSMLQVVVLGCAVVAGAAVQWKLTPSEMFAIPRGIRRELPDRLIVGTGTRQGKGVTVYINRAVTEKMQQLESATKSPSQPAEPSIAAAVEIKPTAQAA